jgi:hypothetical protein
LGSAQTYAEASTIFFYFILCVDAKLHVTQVAPAITLGDAEISNFPRLDTMDTNGNADSLPTIMAEDRRGSLITCSFSSNAQVDT